MGCSLVELIAEDVEMQKPRWFVSHAWLEPITLFVPRVSLGGGSLGEVGLPPQFILVCVWELGRYFGRQNHGANPDVSRF